MNGLLSLPNLHLCNITLCPPEWQVSSSCDPFHRLYFVYSGDAVYQDADETMILNGDTLYLFPANKDYSITHQPDKPLHCLWFHFILDRTLAGNALSYFPHPDSAVFHLTRALERLVSVDADPAIVCSALDALLLILLRDQVMRLSWDERLDPSLRHIRSHFASNPDNTVLAGLAGFNIRYFIRLFKKNLGKTPQEYMADYRCFQAERFLFQGHPVQEVAIMTGFSDAKSFSRFFRQHRAISPSGFRKSYKQQP